jgi:hypothetical protein
MNGAAALAHAMPDPKTPLSAIEHPSLARPLVDAGIRRYFADRRSQVDAFVDRHFTLVGTLRLHHAAVGWDVLRAPANIALALPQFGLQLAGNAAARAGRLRLARALDRRIVLKTAVAQRIEWLLWTELLELPFQQDERRSTRDVLAESILAEAEAHPRVAAALASIGRHAQDEEFRHRLSAALETYTGSRRAAAEITTALVSVSIGALALKQLTPGVVALGPSLAAVLAQQAAIAAFPLGAGLGGVWYGLFPAAPGAGLIAGLTGGLMAAASALAAFTGVLTDPLQRRLGLHRRRLLHLLDTLERQILDPQAPAYTVHDHYVARLVDLLDLLSFAWRVGHL